METPRVPVRVARGRCRPPRGRPRLGPAAGRHRAAGGRRVRRRRHGRLAHGDGGDVERVLGALGDEVEEGTIGAGHGMSCFDYPGRDRHRLARCRRPPRRGAAAVQLRIRRPRVPRRPRASALGPGADGSGPRGSCIAACATDAPMSPHELRRLALRPLLGLARAGSYAADRSGEIGVAFTTSTGPGPVQRRARTPTSRRPTRPRTSRSTTASSRRAPPSGVTGRCRKRSRSRPYGGSPGPATPLQRTEAMSADRHRRLPRRNTRRATTDRRRSPPRGRARVARCFASLPRRAPGSARSR